MQEYHNATTNGENPTPDSFKGRIAAVKQTRWIRFGVVSLIFFLWVAWLGSWWVLLFWPLLFDIYITGYIPLTWWKKSNSKVVRGVMSWVDAIVYALVLVYFVFTFIGQNYTIPSSSLEKTLLTGDYLWVNKMAYGPRVPNTPLHFPLAQHTMPWGSKSYIDKPQWKYHRLKGFGNVERGDIVVFNFPAGDTVALKMQNPDYYTLVAYKGWKAINTDKEVFGDIVYRPVDRRENYVKRCIGLPGERIAIRDGVIYIDGNPLPQPEHVQFNYFFQLPAGQQMTEDDWEELGVARDDRTGLFRLEDISQLSSEKIANVGLSPDDRHVRTITPIDYPNWEAFGLTIRKNESGPQVYYAPLTQAMVESLRAKGATVIRENPRSGAEDLLFPRGISDSWTRADYGYVWIPKKGATIRLTPTNWQVYNRCIRNYENHPDAYLGDDGKVYINGKVADTYTFEMDYYFMMGDNRDNSLDSRYWGFVPEDHIVGRPELVLISFDKDKSILKGGIRTDRIFRRPNPDNISF